MQRLLPPRYQFRLKRQYRYVLGVPVGTILLLLTISLAAFACGPMFVGWVLGGQVMILPASLSLVAYGLPLLAIVPAETFILQQREGIHLRRALGVVLWGNFFYILASLFGLNMGFFFPIVGGLFSAAMFLRFYQRLGFLKRLPGWLFTLLVYVGFVGLDIARLSLMDKIRMATTVSSALSVAAGLIAIGTIFSFVCKGFAISLLLPNREPTFARVVLSMQVTSLVIVGIVGLILAATGFAGSELIPPLSFPSAL